MSHISERRLLFVDWWKLEDITRIADKTDKIGERNTRGTKTFPLL
jgi:hypothetical protein